jgi:hypothetical protein
MNRKTEVDWEVQRKDEGSSNIIISARTEQDTDGVAINMSINTDQIVPINTDQIVLHETGEGRKCYKSL